MDDEVERLTIGVRADTRAFARDVAEIRGQLEGPLGSGVVRAGQLIESTFSRAIRTGKFGFEDLKGVAISVLNEIARAAISKGVNSAGGGNSGTSSLLSAGVQILQSVLGSPGRATGGPVSPGRAYTVGEQGPETFVPTSSGTIVPSGRNAVRDVRVAIAINAPRDTAPDALARSSRQVARAVRGALLQED